MTPTLDETSCTSSGAAAIVAYRQQNELFVASAGNAMAVSCRAGKAMPLNSRHDPYNEDEVKRIRDINAVIGANRQLNGVLDVTRAFGHFDQFPAVNANPQIARLKITSDDEFLILATNAFWRVMSYQTAVDVASMDRKNPSRAAQKLRDYALAYGAREPLTVMVVSYSSQLPSTRRVIKRRYAARFAVVAIGNLRDCACLQQPRR